MRRNVYSSVAAVSTLVDGKEIFGFENRYSCKDGSYRWLRWQSVPVPSEGLVYATALDVTEVKAAEGRIRNMLESAPVALIAVKSDGGIVLANTHAEKLFGAAREELLGCKVETLLPDRYRSGHPALREAFMATPRPRAMGSGRDLFGLRKDGTEFPIEIGLAPIDTPEGPLIVASIIDLTLRKEAEKAVLQARDAAMELARLKSDFLANMSHEIRTPMNAIIGLTGLLLDTPLNEQQKDYVKTVSGAGEALLGVINDMYIIPVYSGPGTFLLSSCRNYDLVH